MDSGCSVGTRVDEVRVYWNRRTRGIQKASKAATKAALLMSARLLEFFACERHGVEDPADSRKGVVSSFLPSSYMFGKS